MPNMNQVNIEGHVGRDPETRYSKKGTAIANFSVATNTTYNEKDFTEWHRVVAFGKLAEACEEKLCKGDGVVVRGRLRTNKWEDKEGVTRYTTEIVATHVALSVFNGMPKQSSGDGRPNVPEDDDGIPF